MKRGRIMRKIRNTGSMLRRGAVKGRSLAGKANRVLGGLPGDILRSAVIHSALAAV